MIKNLKLKNFRKHTDLNLDFSDGVSVVRASNEAGKSTMIEGIMYALFGVKACRDNDISTWGLPENSQRAELTFEANGEQFQVYRTARSAELKGPTLTVSGQSDVTKKCEELLELKPGTGGQLMFVGQGEMRGILEEGSASTTKMIETLADLGLIESWINNLQDNFPTGSTGIVENELQHAKDKLEAAQARLSEIPDAETELKKHIEEDKAQIASLDASISENIEWLGEGELALEVGRRETQRLETEHTKYQVFKRQFDKLTDEKATLAKTISSMDLQPADVSQLGEQVARLAEAESELTAIEDFTQFKDVRGESIPVEQYNQLKAQYETLEAQFGEAQEVWLSQLSAHRGQFIDPDSGKCKACGSILKSAEDIEEHNRRIQLAIAAAEDQLKLLDEKFSPEISGLKQQLARLDQAQSALPRLPKSTQWVLDTNFYPNKLVFTGEVDTTVDVETLSSEIKRLKASIKQTEAQQAAYEAGQKQLSTLLARQQEVERDLADLEPVPKVDWEEVKSAQEHLAESVAQAKELTACIEDQKAILKRVKDGLENPAETYSYLFTEYNAVKKQLDEAQEAVCRYTQAIKDMGNNTSLLKFLRKVKPQVANQVWQTVCQTVSHYFSMMRGQQSIVTKESGFMVDGHNVSSLSGSTLDVLGIAIRVALTKTFLPTCRFLLLDEPFAACSVERQAQALAFITSAGFDQVIIVTHEDTTEAVADQLITLD